MQECLHAFFDFPAWADPGYATQRAAKKVQRAADARRKQEEQDRYRALLPCMAVIFFLTVIFLFFVYALYSLWYAHARPHHPQPPGRMLY